LGKFTEAIKDYETAVVLHNNNRALVCMAYCLNRKIDHRSAIKCYEKALVAGFGTAEVYNNLGYSYVRIPPPNPGERQEYLDKAREYYDQAIQLNKKLQTAYHNRALLDLTKSLVTAQSHSTYVPLDGIADIEKAIELGSATADLYR